MKKLFSLDAELYSKFFSNALFILVSWLFIVVLSTYGSNFVEGMNSVDLENLDLLAEDELIGASDTIDSFIGLLIGLGVSILVYLIISWSLFYIYFPSKLAKKKVQPKSYLFLALWIVIWTLVFGLIIYAGQESSMVLGLTLVSVLFIHLTQIYNEVITKKNPGLLSWKLGFTKLWYMLLVVILNLYLVSAALTVNLILALIVAIILFSLSQKYLKLSMGK